MTPQEQRLVTDLFDRLATLEREPRDPDAERVIRDGLRRAPNGLYALVQTVLLQDEAMRTLQARVQDLESRAGSEGERGQQGGFLDNLRDAVFGREREPAAEPGGARGSVPSVRTGDAPGSRWSTPGGAGPGSAPMGAPGGFGQGPGYGAPGAGGPAGMPPGAAIGGRGGSFLGTAAAAAAGVIGGALLMDSVRHMIGGGADRAGQGALDQAKGGGDASPWGNASGSEMSREAGLDDIDGRRAGAVEDRHAREEPPGGHGGYDTADYEEPGFDQADDFGGDDLDI